MADETANLTRRGFMTKTASGLASAGLLSLSPTAVFGQATENTSGESERQIIRRKLGRTGVELPIVSMGVMNAENPEMVQASYELGVRHFNLSSNYQMGRIETMVSGVINRLGARDKTFYATGEYELSDLTGLDSIACKRKMIASCEASLKRMKTDYIDLYYVYQADDYAQISDKAVIEALEILKSQGKIRYTGISTHSRMADAINAVTKSGYYDVVLTTINFTLADDAALLKAINDAAAAGIGVVAMKVMAAWSRWPNPQTRQQYASSTIATALLKWVMRNENITTCVPGYMNFEHMRQDVSIAFNLEYNEDEKKFLSDNDVKLGVGFCRQCRQCLASCPEGVDIPTLMRTYMYAAQYGDFYKARTTLDSIPTKSGLRACDDCRECRAKCANTVDIARRVDELRTIYC